MPLGPLLTKEAVVMRSSSKGFVITS
jgi:hypothetical protein